MYSFHSVALYLLTIIALHHIAFASSLLPMNESSIHQRADRFDTKLEPQSPSIRHRYRRLFGSVVDLRRYDKQYHSGDHSPVFVQDAQPTGTATTKDFADNIERQATRLLDGATGAVLTPINWLSHITRYWPFYLICIIIILGLGTFLYCSCQSKAVNLFTHQNFEPAALMQMFRQQYPVRLPMTA